MNLESEKSPCLYKKSFDLLIPTITLIMHILLYYNIFDNNKYALTIVMLLTSSIILSIIFKVIQIFRWFRKGNPNRNTIFLFRNFSLLLAIGFLFNIQGHLLILAKKDIAAVNFCPYHLLSANLIYIFIKYLYSELSNTDILYIFTAALLLSVTKITIITPNSKDDAFGLVYYYLTFIGVYLTSFKVENPDRKIGWIKGFLCVAVFGIMLKNTRILLDIIENKAYVLRTARAADNV